MIKGRIIRNPNYGGPDAGLNGWTWRPMAPATSKPQFREALRESVATEGIRNPVVLYSTVEGCFISFGGSRYIAGRDAGLTSIPALVNDYVERFQDGIDITSENVAGFFTDVPETIEFTPDGVDYHYSIERNRRGTFDKAGIEWCKDASFLADEFEWIK